MADVGSERDEAALAARFRDCDPDAVTEIYRRYAGSMYALSRWMLRDGTQAADAVQQAFLRAWRSAGAFDPSRRLSPWLFQITRRVCLDMIRRERRRPLQAELPDDIAVGSEDDAEAVERSWTRWEVRRAIDELPTREREVARLAYVEGLSNREIAARLGVPIGTVKSRTARTQARLCGTLAHLAPPRAARRSCRELMSSLR